MFCRGGGPCTDDKPLAECSHPPENLMVLHTSLQVGPVSLIIPMCHWPCASAYQSPRDNHPNVAAIADHGHECHGQPSFSAARPFLAGLSGDRSRALQITAAPCSRFLWNPMCDDDAVFQMCGKCWGESGVEHREW